MHYTLERVSRVSRRRKITRPLAPLTPPLTLLLSLTLAEAYVRHRAHERVNRCERDNLRNNVMQGLRPCAHAHAHTGLPSGCNVDELELADELLMRAMAPSDSALRTSTGCRHLSERPVDAPTVRRRRSGSLKRSFPVCTVWRPARALQYNIHSQADSCILYSWDLADLQQPGWHGSTWREKKNGTQTSDRAHPLRAQGDALDPTIKL